MCESKKLLKRGSGEVFFLFRAFVPRTQEKIEHKQREKFLHLEREFVEQ